MLTALEKEDGKCLSFVTVPQDEELWVVGRCPEMLGELALQAAVAAECCGGFPGWREKAGLRDRMSK